MSTGFSGEISRHRSSQSYIYVLSRLTFGDKPSPDMASFVMLRMAKENEREFPDASEILCRYRYLDDLIHSRSTPKEAVSRIKASDTVLAQGSFKIKQWFCSLHSAEEEMSGSNYVKKPPVTEINLDGRRGEIKTPGVGWNHQTSDRSHKFYSEKSSISGKFTKRTVLYSDLSPPLD